MTEADLEREASRLFKQLGLKVGAESLNFFLGESLRISDWKKLIKPPRDYHRNNNCDGLRMAESSPTKSGAGQRPRAVLVIPPGVKSDRGLVNGSSNGHYQDLKVVAYGNGMKTRQEYFGKPHTMIARETRAHSV